MQYLVRRGCVINQRPTQPGDVVELDPIAANELVRSRSIEPLPADAPRPRTEPSDWMRRSHGAEVARGKTRR